jgi:transcriptional regulator with XRE-family HTH domain
MISNRVQEMRKRAKLTQKQLASAAQTSQQQIQRIESGNQRPSVQLANKIAGALGQRVDILFSQEEQVFKGRPKVDDYLEKRVGIEASDGVWYFRFSLRGGAEGVLRLCFSEKEILYDAMWNLATEFIVVDTDTSRVAINTLHVVSCQFSEDIFPSVPVVESASSGEVHLAQLYLATSPQVQEIRIRPDTHDIEDEPDEGDYMAYNQMAFHELDSPARPGQRIGIVGERREEETFVLKSDIAMLAIPLECCDMSLRKAMLEGAAEEQGHVVA